MQSLAMFRKEKVKQVSLDKILLGGEHNLFGYQYSLLNGNYRRPSTLAKDSPHSQLILSFKELGDEILEKENFRKTAYFSNARDCIDIFGHYFPGIDTEDKIVLAAERFLRLFENKDVSHLPSEGHSGNGELVHLAPIQDSDCYQIIQGNHRVAFAIAKGEPSVKSTILCKQSQLTPVQFLLQNLQWEKGKKLLYQPLSCPELELNWSLARKCVDRKEKMMSFLDSIGLEPSKNLKFIDLGSYYGWFVSQFSEVGFQAIGVEKDNIPIQVGKIAYGNLDNNIFRDEIVRFLERNRETYDIVCCLSIMHHLIYGRDKGDSNHLLHLLDNTTAKVLFFEMGEEHETWFSNLLSGWNAEKIKKWILSNTSFTSCTLLGRDEDSNGDFDGNFGRMLFAFTK